MIGTTLSHYRIVEKIGEGGMGEVYRAHDERLDRDVAVKVLPEAVAQDADRLARFEREAKAVARLSHPNILEIFDFGREGEVTYAVTELLDGETLRERLEAGGLGWPKATEIGAAIADGLAAAHQAGIVHRDLKPSNIFMTFDGRVKVLDFGLARTLEMPDAGESHSPTVSRYTDPGSVLGTVGYMSPEQVRGEPADHRSDIFSLGCVLYEMVCGRRAFLRDTAVETMNAILKEEPSDLRSLVVELPPTLTNNICRCLEKLPKSRFQSGQDLAFALRSVLQDNSGPIAHATEDEKSIVVLPFDNLSPDPDQEYFSDGLTEEIISDLAKVRSLRVISRTSAMQLKGTDKDLRTIGRELNVRYVLEGSVRRAGNALRITAQLIDAATDTHLWAEKFTGTLDDVFDIQERCSRGIVEALKLRLTPAEDEKLAERPLANPQAYELYKKAQYVMWRGDVVGLDSAERHLERGLEIIGENAVIYRGLCQVYHMYLDYGLRTDEATLQKADEYARAVLRLDPGSADGHHLFGVLERFRGTIANALTHLRRAVAINPSDDMTLFWLAWMLALQAGKPSAAEPLVERLIGIDPLTPINYYPRAWVQMARQQLPEAIETLEVLLRAEPAQAWPKFHLALFLAWLGRTDEALDHFEDLREGRTYGNVVNTVSALAMHALKGDEERALAVMTSEVEQHCWNDPELPWLLAGHYALLDRKDEALHWLERAIERGWINYPLFAGQDPFFENIRGDERFQRLMDRIKPEWERFQVGIDLSGFPPVDDG